MSFGLFRRELPVDKTGLEVGLDRCLNAPMYRERQAGIFSWGKAMSIANSDAHRILRRRQVEERTGLSRSTIYRRMQAGTFPPAIPLGGRLVGWRAGDIEQFLESPARYRAPARERDDDVGGAP